MRAFLLAALIALAACAPGPDAPRMTSVAGYDTSRLVGVWHEVAAVGRAPRGTWTIQDQPGGALAVTIAGAESAITVRDEGNGRLAFAGPTGTIFVLWADGDDRTVVLGRPDHRFGVILNRTSRVSPDRLTAAREIMVWNGYEPEAIR